MSIAKSIMLKTVLLFSVSLAVASCLLACGSGSKDAVAENNGAAVSNEAEEWETGEVPSGKIVMQKNASDYIGSEWTVETLTDYFQELGFSNISTVPCEPNDDNYEFNIQELSIKKGLFSSGAWEAGEEFSPDDEISIYFNESSLLTTDNCSDLVDLLADEDPDYMSFADEYDGRYVEFDAYVINHITYDGDTSHIIDAAGGDYDGASELGVCAGEESGVSIVRIGDRSWGNDVNKGVKEGQNVRVCGKIDASWSEYYEQLYVEGLSLMGR